MEVYYYRFYSGVGGTGTLRQNRLGPIPLPKKKEVERNFDRGDFADVYSDDITTIVWQDNKPVYMASNEHQV